MGEVKGPKSNAIFHRFSSIWGAHLGQFWCKNGPKTGSKNEFENERFQFGLGRGDTAPRRLQGDSE